VNGITRWAEVRRAIASWAAARSRLARWVAFGLVACAAPGYGVTFTWMGHGPLANHDGPRELAIRGVTGTTPLEIWRLPPVNNTYSAIGDPARHASLRDCGRHGNLAAVRGLIETWTLIPYVRLGKQGVLGLLRIQPS
jgi:hypothetical protein